MVGACLLFSSFSVCNTFCTSNYGIACIRYFTGMKIISTNVRTLLYHIIYKILLVSCKRRSRVRIKLKGWYSDISYWIPFGERLKQPKRDAAIGTRECLTTVLENPPQISQPRERKKGWLDIGYWILDIG
ncbi:hypothetical protein VNO78_14983 [Psophocarpus tetragonolobus]|uniref:Uncharacterized protein n=1 Tax=Psophocarpus tetragonolobus TaxID=3891 RepID=A0AAN9XJ77_PSOTE